MSLAAVLIVPQAVRATPTPTPNSSPAQWSATVGAQSGDKGHQALAFLPNEFWIHVGDSITWRWDVDEIHTVTFVQDGIARPDFTVGPLLSDSATFDDTATVTTTAVAKPATFTVTFKVAGNFKQVCLVHERMTGAVHVLDRSLPLPHDQGFYDRQAAEQRQALLSDEGFGGSHWQHSDHMAHHSTDAHLVIVGVGEITATAGGSQTLSVVRFDEDTITIRAGQTVEWDNHDPVTPHTITFGTPPQNPAPPSGSVTIAPDAEGVLHATISSNADTVNSGLIVAPPQERLDFLQEPLGFTQTRFRVTFKNAGTFTYVCALQDDLGMKGTVIVVSP